MFMEEKNGRWTPPQCAPFSGEYSDLAPFLTVDGKRLYFASNRPGGFGKGDIWYVERTDTGWSAAVNIGSPPNSPETETQPTLTADGTLYFVCSMDSVKWNRGIYRSRMIDGKYAEPEALASSINTEHADIYPFIAPDESYLLFGSGRPGHFSTETDLYISFRSDDGSWIEPVNMGQAINNGSSVSFGCTTSDGKYIFFNRFNEGTDVFYWIDSKIIDRYRPAKTD
jgi:hypothetical protein